MHGLQAAGAVDVGDGRDFRALLRADRKHLHHEGDIVETCPHWSIATGGGPASVERQEFTWVNTLLGNVKNSLHGTYHAIHGKHLGRYLGAFAYRFNRRFSLDRMVERLAYIAYRTAPLPYRFATMAEIHIERCMM